MSLNLKTLNFILGIGVIVGGFLVIIPITIHFLITSNQGFGFGLLFIPIFLPLSFSVIFGLIPMLSSPNLRIKFYQLIHIITAIIGVLSFIIIPIIPTVLIGLPITLIMLSILNQKNLELQLTMTNSAVLICEVFFLIMELSFGRDIPLLGV